MATATSLCSRLSEITPEKLEQLDEEQILALTEVALGERYARIDALCSQKVASDHAGPLYWLQNHTKTLDDHAIQKGTPPKMPFPRKAYFVPLMRALMEELRLLIPKTREMITSWTICGYITWLAQWHGPLTGVIQTVKEEKAKELIRYCTILTENQEPFLSERHPLKSSTDLKLEWASGSRIFGIPGGEDQIRMYHPHVVVFDEMASMWDAEQCWNTAHPVATQMIGVSSARPGWFAEMCQVEAEHEQPTVVERMVKAKLERAPYPYPIDRQHC
jgi:hypothetical protein